MSLSLQVSLGRGGALGGGGDWAVQCVGLPVLRQHHLPRVELPALQPARGQHDSIDIMEFLCTQ